MQQWTPRGLADKIRSLNESNYWSSEAIVALDASDEVTKAAVWNATEEDAIALVDKLLQRSAKRRRLEELPTPSALAHPPTWQAVQRQHQDAPIFRCFRPGGTTPTAALPVGLYAPELDRVVGMFAQAVNGDEDDDPLSQEDCQVAFNLCEEMGQRFVSKVEREQAFVAHLERYFDMTINRVRPNTIIWPTAFSDGSIRCHIKYDGAPRAVPIYIQAVKAEIGTDGDPYFEGQRRYQLYLMNERLAPVVRDSVLPVLFVELVGPHIRVSALASPEDACVVCEPLTPYLHLVNMLSAQRGHMHRVARVLRALKRSVVILNEACSKLSQPPAAAPARLGAEAGAAAAAASQPSTRDLHLQLPYPLRPGSGFEDVDALVPGNSKLLYAATHVQSGREVLVKFSSASKHATRVHAAWAAAGLAPQLIESQLLPCGLTMHVMEYLSPDDGWTMFYSLPPARKQQLSDMILAKLEEAHAVDVGDGARAVHADMRQGNVMVKLRMDGSEQQLEEPHQVRFLDFDWSGLVGQTRLPPFMRQRIGYGAGQEVTQQYDRDLWRHELVWGDA